MRPLVKILSPLVTNLLLSLTVKEFGDAIGKSRHVVRRFCATVYISKVKKIPEHP